MIRMMMPPFLRQNLGPIPHLDGNDNVGPMFDDVVDGIVGKIVDECDPRIDLVKCPLDVIVRNGV